jgi:proteasome lid subunit RPN8/RPN11
LLRLSQQIYDAIRQHGEETYPHECCGVLLGRFLTGVNAVEDAIRAGNTRTDSAHNRYHIAPQELVKIQRLGRERELDIVGFYHSHPDHPAQWSPTDFAEAHWIGCSYVITAVEQGAARQTNSFLLTGITEDDKAFEDEAIEVTGQLDPGLEPEAFPEPRQKHGSGGMGL